MSDADRGMPTLIALMIPAVAWASEPSFDELLDMDLGSLVEMEVTTPARKGQVAAEAPASVTVVTREMIARRGYLTLEDVLRDVPGFDIATGQPAGEYPTHFLYRGIGDVGQTKVLTMVDGIVRNDVSNGWARNVGYDFALGDVEKIEIIGGPASALYGANAYAGLVNVITRRPEAAPEGLSLEASAAMGSNSTAAPEVVVRYRAANGLAAQLAGRWFHSDGDGGQDRWDPGRYYHGNFEPDSVQTTEHGVIVNEQNADGSRLTVPDGFGTDVDDVFLRGRLSTGGFGAGFTFWDRDEGLGSEVVGYEYFANTSGLDYRAHHRGYTAYADYRFQLAPGAESYTRAYFRSNQILPETGFYYTFQYQGVDNGVDAATVDKKKGYHGEGFAAGADQQVNVELSERNSLVGGIQVAQEIKQYFGISLGPEQDASSTVVASTYATEERTVQPVFFSRKAAVYVQDEHRFRDGYALTGGLRVDLDEEYGQTVNPRVSLVRSPKRGMGFKVLYGRAFKAPTVFEQFDEWRGNADLHPEKIGTGEIEVSYQLEERAYLRAGLFHSQLTDLIAVAPNPDTTRVPVGPQGQYADYYQNVGSTDVTGLVLGADVQLAEQAFGYANYSYTRGEDGELDNISQHKVNAGVNVRAHKHLNANLRCNWRGKMRAPTSNLYLHPKSDATVAAVGYDYLTESDPDGYLDGHFLVHATFTGAGLFGRKWDLQPQLIVRNLLGADYATVGRQSGSGTRPVDELQPLIRNPNGFIPAYHPQPGRQILLVLRYSL